MPIPLGMMLALGATATSALTNKSNQEQQLAQQRKLTDQQVGAQMRLGRFNQELAMKTWDQTNYAAQVEQMKKAGLNPGLMYDGQGGGGTTSGGQASGSVTGGQASANAAGMGLQTGMQAAMTAAQIKNLDANTEKTKVETLKQGGVDTDVALGQLAKLSAETNNEKLKGALIGLETDLKAIDVEKGNRSMEANITAIKAASQRAEAEAREAAVKAGTAEATQETTIKIMKAASTEQMLRIAQQGKNLKLTDQQIEKIAKEINLATQGNIREWAKLNASEQQAIQKVAEENGGGAILDIIKLLF